MREVGAALIFFLSFLDQAKKGSRVWVKRQLISNIWGSSELNTKHHLTCAR